MSSDIFWIRHIGPVPNPGTNLNMQCICTDGSDGFIAGGSIGSDGNTNAAMYRLGSDGSISWAIRFQDRPFSYCNDLVMDANGITSSCQSGLQTRLSWHDPTTGRIYRSMLLREDRGLSINVSGIGKGDSPLFSGQIGSVDFFSRTNQGVIGKSGGWCAYVGGGEHGISSLFANAEDGLGSSYTVGLWHDAKINHRQGADHDLRTQQNMVMRWDDVHGRGRLSWAIAIEPPCVDGTEWTIAWFNVVTDAEGNAVIIGEDNLEKVTIAKVSPTGGVIWMTRLNNGANNGGYPGLQVDAKGDILAGGAPGYAMPQGGYIYSYKLSGVDGSVIWQRMLTNGHPISLFWNFGVRCMAAADGCYGMVGWTAIGEGSARQAFVTRLPSDGSLQGNHGGWIYQDASWQYEMLSARVIEISPPIEYGSISSTEAGTAVLNLRDQTSGIIAVG